MPNRILGFVFDISDDLDFNLYVTELFDFFIPVADDLELFFDVSDYLDTKLYVTELFDLFVSVADKLDWSLMFLMT